jgi:L-asparaginase II
MELMTRSCIKPFQILPLLLSGAADQYGFTPKQLAIMCGSHNGSDDHRQVVLENLALSGCAPKDLQCGCHVPLQMREQRIFPANGEEKDTVRHNCSGKHSGFLALSKFLGEDITSYLDPESKIQKLIKNAVADYCEYPPDRMTTAVDGCSAPNFSLPLVNIALAFKKLASAEGADEKSRAVIEKVRSAMLDFPEMVSGEGRLDLDIMRSFPDRVVCKIGAEALEGIGFVDPPIGIAVKIHDGANRALGAVCFEVLKQLGIIEKNDDLKLLERYRRPDVKNVMGLVTGYIECDFELKTV